MKVMIQNFVGHRFNRLFVRSYSGKDQRRNTLFECTCDCGAICIKRGSDLKSGYVQSCGCLQKEAAAIHIKSLTPQQRKHKVLRGYTRSLTGVSWAMAVQRCYNPKREDYPRYGGRGIRMCEFIRLSPINLAALLGERPSKQLSLDRIDVDGHYSCGECADCIEHGLSLNVRLATEKEQQNNRRNGRAYRAKKHLEGLSA